MLITSDSKVFNPKKNTKLTDKLNEIHCWFNDKMTDHKARWATSVMHYNLCSKEAYKRRFLVKTLEDGRQDSFGEDRDTYTEESRRGPYIVKPAVKKVVDNYYTEFLAREFDCEVKAIGSEKYRHLVKYLQDTSFDEAHFRTALSDAFKDALLKGVGFVRPRIYDIEIDDSENNKKLPKRLGKLKNISHTKKGFQLEYVNVENVYFDPHIKQNEELIISTPMSELELVKILPQMEDKLITLYNTNDDNGKGFWNDDKSKGKNGDSSQSFWIENYLVGETLSKWYLEYETVLDFSQRSKPDGKIEDYDRINNGLSNGIYSNFDSFWRSAFLGEDYNCWGRKYFEQEQKYRLNEYYNKAQNKYIVWIGGYVLYDGPMLEHDLETPIYPIYFDHCESDGLIGKSVNDHINSLQIDLSEQATCNKELLDMSTTNFLAVDTTKIKDSDNPIKADKLTVVEIQNTTQDGQVDPSPAIQPIPIQFPSLEINFQNEQKLLAEIEAIFPNTEPIYTQQPVQDREQTIRARTLWVDRFLKTNALNLSKYAYNVLNAKLMSLFYLQEDDTMLRTNADTAINIIIREDEKELIEAKKLVQELLKQEREVLVQQTMAELASNPKFMAQIEQQMQAYAQQMQQEAELIAQDESIPEEAKATAQSPEFQSQAIQQKQLEAITEAAEAQVPQKEDENMYVNLSDIQDIFMIKKDFQFNFLKTKEEQKRQIQEFLQLINNLPLAGQAIDYTNFLKETVVAYGFSPDVIFKDAGDPNQLQANSTTRFTHYIDHQKYPTVSQAIMGKAYGINVEDNVESVKSNSFFANLIATTDLEAQKEIKVTTARLQQQGKNQIANTGLNAQLKGAQAEEERKAEAIEPVSSTAIDGDGYIDA